jgi:quercetin dioxygenase-like cupin family protein
VRIWDVTVPGGDATLWHAHRNDNVVVTLAPAKLHIETLDKDPVDAEWKFGEVRFSKATYIHRAMNVGPTAFHNLTIELLKPADAGMQTMPGAAGREPVLENDRVRVYRASLAPGESVATHTHQFRIWMSPCLPLKSKLPPTARTVRHPVKRMMSVGEPAGVTHSIKNVGRTRFEAVSIEFK